MLKPELKPWQVVEQLDSGYHWEGPVVTFSFPLTVPKEWAELHNQPFASPFIPFTTDQQEMAQRALELWSDVANITFKEVEDQDGQIRFGNSGTVAPSPSDGQASSPGEGVGGDVFLNPDVPANFVLEYGGMGFNSMLHEIGHALGLSHPGDYDVDLTGDDPPNYAQDAEYYQDSRQYTLMSYFSAAETGADHVALAATPLLHDIYAIQDIYGTNLTTRTGDTIYGYNSTADRAAFDFTVNLNPVIAIWDAGGIDTLDLSGSFKDAKINLRTGGFSDTHGMTGNIAIAYKALIENAVGGDGDDIITGNSAENVLRGGDGDDTIYGQQEDDYFPEGSDDDDDTLHGEKGDDVIRADVGNDWLSGGDDADDLDGETGNDTAYGGDGDDVIVGGEGSDTLSGEDGNDVIHGLVPKYQDNTYAAWLEDDDNIYAGAGDDVVHGGLGDDDIFGDGVFGDVNGPLLTGNDKLFGEEGVDLIRGMHGDDLVAGGDGDDDVGGGDGNDFVDGGDGIDLVRGDDGNDALHGGSGADALFGGDDNDTLSGGTGLDYFDGGAGTDMVDYFWEAGNWIVRLDHEWAADGVNNPQETFLSIENAHLSQGNDLAYGTAGANEIWGNGGNDVIEGAGGVDTLHGGSGDDTLRGGNGNDTLDPGTGKDTVNGGAGTDTVTYYDTEDKVEVRLNAGTAAGLSIGNDVLQSIENATGGSGSDVLVGTGTNNVLVGNDGDDRLEGLGGNDALLGGNGDDGLLPGWGHGVVDGGTGRDRVDYSDTDLDWTISLLPGGAASATTPFGVSFVQQLISIEHVSGGLGDDEITGNGDGNTLSGGDGDDVIAPGAGEDFVWGGPGGDTFVFAFKNGVDTIHDFEDGEDLIAIAGFAGIDSFDDLTISASGADVVVTLGADQLRLIGTATTQITGSDFVFV